jgi:hypothetical protein
MCYIANTKLRFLSCPAVNSMDIFFALSLSLPDVLQYFFRPSTFLFTKVHFPNGFNRNALQVHVFLITPIGRTCKLLPLVQWLEHLLHIREFRAMVLSAVCILRVFHRYSQILQGIAGIIR